MAINKTTLTFIVWALAIISGVLLLYTSQSVHDQRRALRHANAQIEKQTQTIRVLQAEWAFLSSPSHLEDMLGRVNLSVGISNPPQTLPTLQDAQFVLCNPAREQVLDISLQE